ncbi:MAG: FtsQ-type POTRA domain-containing protein, partial [Humidesulfovibrio sp.]|nr:FtsQ-type POTRA domain-containing protein [Humidesulfovibrio sp.]
MMRSGGMQRKPRDGRKPPVRLNRQRKDGGVGLVMDTAVAVKNALLFFAAILVLVSLGAALIFGYRFVTTTPALGLAEITVSGNMRLAYGQVLEIAGLRLGQNSIGVNVSRVETALSSNPWVEFVTVR